MRPRAFAVLSLLAIPAIVFPAWAGRAGPLEAEVQVGASLNGSSGEHTRAAEYDSRADDEATGHVGASADYYDDEVRITFEGTFRDADDQKYEGRVEFGRNVFFESEYDRFYHRLDHDNLEHEAARLSRPDQGATVLYTDYDAGRDYGIRRTEWRTALDIKLENLPGVVLSLNHRTETRSGWEQARTLSKCGACHVTADGKMVNESTNEFSPGIRVQRGRIAMEYRFTYRTFSAGDPVYATYMEATRPGIPPNPDFDAQLQYDYSNGSLPYSRTPDSEKWSHVVQAKADISERQVLNLGFMYSKSRNNDTDSGGGDPLYGDFDEELETDYWSLNAAWHWRATPDVSMTVRGSYYQMDGDEVFVDVHEPLPGEAPRDPGAPTGPFGDQTYAEWLAAGGVDYGDGSFDYTRYSAYDENGLTLGADISWRLLHSLKLSFGYEYELVDRENAEYHDVTDETTSHTFDVGARWRPLRRLTLSAKYAYTFYQDPYRVEDAACPSQDEAEGFDPSFVGGGITPTSMYDYYVYGSRTTSKTALPETVHDLSVNASLQLLDRLSGSAYLRYTAAQNDDADDEWEHDTYNTGVNLTFLPMERWGIHVGYNYFLDKYGSRFCTGIYHG